ncbi:LPXTG cell wall anchor domain-containing protein [Aerococcaceae bacterium zg-ZJ1578]|uniref:LPXTG cell wall anchor domain-containing protein n=1 Tax=Aerococcaceae bacterium zg-252 TaxID=2796928 RepID=UPI001A2FA3EA|nr:LPXTG cell wall anchor domain-containing protein [Aerococcaceae bacterium zg-1578]
MKKKSLLAATLLASQLVMSAVSAQEETTLPPEVSQTVTSVTETTVSETTTSDMPTADTTSEMPTSSVVAGANDENAEMVQFRIRVVPIDGTEYLAGAQIIIRDENGNQVGSYISDENGYITATARKGSKLKCYFGEIPAGWAPFTKGIVLSEGVLSFTVEENMEEMYVGVGFDHSAFFGASGAEFTKYAEIVTERFTETEKAEMVQFKIRTIDQDEASVAGVQVIIRDTKGNRLGSYLSDADGYVVLRARKGITLQYGIGEQPNGYGVVASDQDGNGNELTVTEKMNDVSLHVISNTEVKPEPKTEDKVETFQFRIGVMVDNSAVEEGIKGATVIIKDSNGKQIGSFKTGASGYITLSARKGAKLTYELTDFPEGYAINDNPEVRSYKTSHTFEVGEPYGETYRIALRKLDTTPPAPAENKPEVKPEDKQDVPDNSKEVTVAKEVDNKKDDKKEAEKSDSDVRKELLALINDSQLTGEQKDNLAVEASFATNKVELEKVAAKVKEMTATEVETTKVEVQTEAAKTVPAAENKAALPKTGESTSFAALALAVLSVVAGALLVAPRFKKQK